MEQSLPYHYDFTFCKTQNNQIPSDFSFSFWDSPLPSQSFYPSPPLSAPFTPQDFRSHPDGMPPRTKLNIVRWERSPDSPPIEVYQVEARGVVVSRRADNSMCNATKLLNVKGLSRGRRDGILKNIRDHRDVVKSGPMALKGVYITLEKARQLASTHDLLDELFPLFEKDISQYTSDTTDPNPTSESLTLMRTPANSNYITSPIPSFSNTYGVSVLSTPAPTPYNHNAQFPFTYLCQQSQPQSQRCYPSSAVVHPSGVSQKRHREYEVTTPSKEYIQPQPKRVRYTHPDLIFQSQPSQAVQPQVLSPSVSSLSSGSDHSTWNNRTSSALGH